MNTFDPAINYGPNDAGITAFSIIFAILILIVGTWSISLLFSYVSRYFNKDN